MSLHRIEPRYSISMSQPFFFHFFLTSIRLTWVQGSSVSLRERCGKLRYVSYESRLRFFSNLRYLTVYVTRLGPHWVALMWEVQCLRQGTWGKPLIQGKYRVTAPQPALVASPKNDLFLSTYFQTYIHLNLKRPMGPKHSLGQRLLEGKPDLYRTYPCSYK